MRHHVRRRTHPHLLSSRQKPRRWPLVFRFIKGAIHGAILLPVGLHVLFAALVVCLDEYILANAGLPNSIIPSLSIVVGLMLVFRNQTSYNRFWDGRNGMTSIQTCVRNIVRTITTHAYNPRRPLTAAEKEDIERTIRILMAIPFAVKNYLRNEWNAAWAASSSIADTGPAVFNPDYAGLLPLGLEGHEDEGLGFPYQLTFFVDAFLKRGEERGWFSAPETSGLQTQLNNLLDAYGRMETIKLTPIPVAHLIHQKQVLALFGCVLPFAMVDDMGWWTLPMVTLVTFTLYGIEGIGSQLEDPFGYDRIDIKMDAIAGDAKTELDVVLSEWRKLIKEVEMTQQTSNQIPGEQGESGGEMVNFFLYPDMFLKIKPPAPRTVVQLCRDESDLTAVNAE